MKHGSVVQEERGEERGGLVGWLVDEAARKQADNQVKAFAVRLN